MKNDNVQLSILKTQDGNLQESIIENFIAQQFKFSTGNQVIKDRENFLKEISEKYGNNITITSFNQGFGLFGIYVHKSKGVEKISDDIDDFLIYIQAGKKESVVEIYANSIEDAGLIYNFVFSHSDTQEEMKIQMHNYFFEGRLTHDTSILKEKDLEQTDGDYYPDFVSTDIFFEQFTKARETILILAGVSGLGKTKLATHYMHFLLKNSDILKRNEVKTISEESLIFQDIENEDEMEDEESKYYINVAYVKNEDILAMDKFWVNLRRNDYDIVIFDDLDYFLSPREQVITSKEDVDKNKFISNFLSFTDGIVPSKTKFIIATNRGVESIDEALQRDGRLFGVYELSQLTYDEALAIWLKNDLKEISFKELFEGQKFILQAELGSKVNIYKENNGEKPISFLKEGSEADISDRFLHTKRAGFKP